MQLISLSDFVLEKNEFSLFKKNDDQIRKYAEFLQKDLKLNMFVDSNTHIKSLYESDALSCKNTILEYEKNIDEKDRGIIFLNVKMQALINNDIGVFLGGKLIFKINTQRYDKSITQYCETIENMLFEVKTPIFITQSF